MFLAGIARAVVMVVKDTVTSIQTESSIISDCLGRIAVSFRVEAAAASFLGRDDSVLSWTGGANSVET